MERIARIGSLALLFCAVACGGGGDDAQADEGAGQDSDATGSVDPAEKKQIDDLLSQVSGTGADKDGDGIEDATEELLLRRYRPYVKFSKNGDGKDEANRP